MFPLQETISTCLPWEATYLVGCMAWVHSVTIGHPVAVVGIAIFLHLIFRGKVVTHFFLFFSDNNVLVDWYGIRHNGFRVQAFE